MDTPIKPAFSHPALMKGLSPEGLLDAVLGGGGADWDPPEASEVEAWFSGYAGFAFIDRGSMGAVYAATQLSLDRRVAIKILPPELRLNPDFVTRFKREAKLLAKLQHPNIVAIYDSGTTDNGHAFIVMEYVQGTSLLDILRERDIPLAEAIEMTHQVARALAMAHEHGVIHRDIKPTNILIDEWGRARVADFGLAKLIGQNWFDADALGGTGAGLGTPGYAAPEQKRSDPWVDHRTDLFSLGITLRELISREVSDDGDDLSDLASKGCPRFVTKIITRAIQEEPAHRFQSATEMAAALSSAMGRLNRPALPAQLLQKPLTAMVIGIQLVVTSWLLYDKVQGEWISRPPPASAPQTNLIPLEGTPFTVLAERLTWPQARGQVIALNCGPHAAPSSPDEWDALRRSLKELGIQAPLWVQSPGSGPPLLYHPAAGATSKPTASGTKAWSLIHGHPVQPVR